MTQHRKARPTKYRGIQMRSRLEASIAQWLDAEGVDWTYEPEAFASEEGQYLPDFELRHVEMFVTTTLVENPRYIEEESTDFRVQYMPIPAPVYLEVKPNIEAASEQMDRVAPIIRATHPTATLMATGWRDPGAHVHPFVTDGPQPWLIDFADPTLDDTYKRRRGGVAYLGHETGHYAPTFVTELYGSHLLNAILSPLASDDSWPWRKQSGP